MIIWFTGLSGAGKSTLANALAKRISRDGIVPFMIDGDVMRLGLTSDLGYSMSDRSENVRRAGGAALLAAKSGIMSICSLISPLRVDRDSVRQLIENHGVPFTEIYVETPLEVCETRDIKGLYKKARSGEIEEFTGISSPYEPPHHPDFVVNTSLSSVEENIKDIYSFLSKAEFYKNIRVLCS